MGIVKSIIGDKKKILIMIRRKPDGNQARKGTARRAVAIRQEKIGQG